MKNKSKNSKKGRPPKVPRQKQSVTNTENKENMAKTSRNIEEKQNKKPAKQMLTNNNAITVNTDSFVQKETDSKRNKRSIETIYENQELDTSAIVNSTVILPDNTDTINISANTEYKNNQTPSKQTGSEATFIVNKKQKLNTETTDSNTRPDSPPMPTISSEFSRRRNKKAINYQEVPLNLKMRSENNLIFIGSNKK